MGNETFYWDGLIKIHAFYLSGRFLITFETAITIPLPVKEEETA